MRFPIFCVFCAIISLCRCSNTDVSGTGSHAGNGVVIGQVVGVDSLAAGNVAVYIRSASYLRDTALCDTKRVPAAYTDQWGRFRLDSLFPGNYTIEFNDEASAASQKTITVDAFKNTIVLDHPVQLKHYASFVGRVSRDMIPPFVSIFIQIYGMEYVQAADSGGQFSFSTLPEGEMRLRIFTSDSSLGLLSGESVILSACDTVDAGEFSLPFEYWKDTVVVRSILNANNLFTVSVAEVATPQQGRIVELNLSNRGVNQIPAQIRSLSLHRLLLANNNLDTLPEEVGWIGALSHLDVSGNRLQHLPHSLQSSGRLQKLNISNNQFRSVSFIGGRMESLEYLFCRNNMIDRLPEPIGRLRHLKELDVAYNELSDLPQSIIELTQLDYISVNYNRLTALSEPLENWIDAYSADDRWRETQKF
ncbi:MAG: leucine-rich repeat domain-containing protein [Chitinivibrionales bacterium]|nr:leucine-rich repeat domain-containing protein [Chitinivibrionales bacterium]